MHAAACPLRSPKVVSFDVCWQPKVCLSLQHGVCLVVGWLGGWCGCSLLTLCCSQLRIRFVVAAGRHGVGLGGWDDTTLLEACCNG